MIADLEPFVFWVRPPNDTGQPNITTIDDVRNLTRKVSTGLIIRTFMW